MKSNFDKQIKESLDQLEFQYNPDAWKAMQKRLDVVKPVSKLPLYLGLGGTAAAIVAGIFIWNASTQVTNDKTNDAAQPNTELNVAENSSAQSSSSNSASNSSTSASNTTKPNASSANPSDHANNSSSANTTTSNSASTSNGTTNQTGVDNNRQHNNNNDNNNNSNQQVSPGSNDMQDTKTLMIPVLPENMCLGTAESIYNKNGMAAVVISPRGSETWIKANSSTNFNPKTAGIYEFGYYKNEVFVKKAQFEVLDAPGADFHILNSDIKYENGLPVTELRCDEVAANYQWDVEGAKLSGKEVSAHLFKKGSHQIVLTVTGANGCKSQRVQTVKVDEAYNLMAVNSFVPSDANPENNTFMPYSLKLRNTPFRLIILDPSDGHVLYETSDASMGWDGIDMQTGQLVPYEKAYIWKVVLSKAEKNEPSEYAGTIIPLANRR